MTFGEAVMEALAAWDAWEVDASRSGSWYAGLQEMEESMERLREKAAGLIEAISQPQVISLKAARDQAELDARMGR